jgi:hypothetical protein
MGANSGRVVWKTPADSDGQHPRDVGGWEPIDGLVHTAASGIHSTLVGDNVHVAVGGLHVVSTCRKRRSASRVGWRAAAWVGGLEGSGAGGQAVATTHAGGQWWWL